VDVQALRVTNMLCAVLQHVSALTTHTALHEKEQFYCHVYDKSLLKCLTLPDDGFLKTGNMLHYTVQ
jgi:hypothetical protein